MLKSIVDGSRHKYHFCRDKHVFVAPTKKQNKNTTTKNTTKTRLLSRQKVFIATKVLSRQAYFCHDKKTCFVVESTCLSRQKHACRHKTFVKIMFVAINQTIFSRKNVFHRHTLVATKKVLCRDKKRVMPRQTRVCRDDIFAATEMIVVAAPATDKRVQLLSGRLLGK